MSAWNGYEETESSHLKSLLKHKINMEIKDLSISDLKAFYDFSKEQKLNRNITQEATEYWKNINALCYAELNKRSTDIFQK
jgi:hypothetical protein